MPGTRASCPIPHKFLQQRCEACHVAAVHADPQRGLRRLPRHRAPSLRRPGRIDHGSPAVRRASSRCAASRATPSIAARTARSRASRRCASRCHQDLTPVRGRDRARATPPISAATHPAVQAHGVIDAAAGKVERLELGGPVPLKESSGLVFNHLCHLGGLKKTPPASRRSPAGRRAQPRRPARGARPIPDRTPWRPDTGRVSSAIGSAACSRSTFQSRRNQLLRQADLRQLPSAGRRRRQHAAGRHGAALLLLPLAEFDKDKPDRVLPHGKPEEVVDVLDLLLRCRGGPAARCCAPTRPSSAGGPGPRPSPPRRPGRRRPGAAAAAANPPSPSGSSACSPTTATSTCGYCHQTTAAPTDKAGRLRHRAGAGAGHLGAAGALQPRAARQPALRALPRGRQIVAYSSDVLLPPIANCRECHLGEAAAAAVPSTCTMCHVYHQKQDTCPMVPAAGAVATAGGAACPTAATTAAVDGGRMTAGSVDQPEGVPYREHDDCVIDALTCVRLPKLSRWAS